MALICHGFFACHFIIFQRKIAIYFLIWWGTIASTPTIYNFFSISWGFSCIFHRLNPIFPILVGNTSLFSPTIYSFSSISWSFSYIFHQLNLIFPILVGNNISIWFATFNQTFVFCCYPVILCYYSVFHHNDSYTISKKYWIKPKVLQIYADILSVSKGCNKI